MLAYAAPICMPSREARPFLTSRSSLDMSSVHRCFAAVQGLITYKKVSGWLWRPCSHAATARFAAQATTISANSASFLVLRLMAHCENGLSCLPRSSYQLPDGVSPEQGALGEPLAVAVHAVNQSKRNLEGANIIISGAGAIGLLIALVAEQKGANQVLLLDVDEKRRLFAQEMGFQTAHPEEAPSSTADCIFIATGAPEAIAAIPELLAPLGLGVIVGIITKAHLNWLQLLFKEGSVTTSRYFTLSDFQEAIQLLGIPGFKAKSLIQEQVSFAELFVDDGQKVMSRAQQVLRMLIKM